MDLAPIPVFAGRITDEGVIKLKHPRVYQRYLSQLAGRDVVVLVREPHELHYQVFNSD